MLSRRTLLAQLGAAAALAAVRRAGAQPKTVPPALAPPDLELRDLQVEGDRSLGRRFTLLVPRHLASGERVPLLVVLHGLGETGDERMGAYAWLERYGVGTAYERLRRAPIARTSKRGEWTDARLTEVNASLAKAPFRGLSIACPYTPNIPKLPNPPAALEGYARWLAEVVVPRARREASALPEPASTGLDGCSLGGYVGLEAFLRRPETFGAWGGVQSAFGAHRAASYAERIAAAIARVGPRRLHVETSTGDPFHDGNVALAKALSDKGIPVERRVLPGPHDQPWLREAGTAEMLLWHDRALR